MRTALEEKLTQALAQRAAAVPPGSGQRLRAVDYHPRRHRLGVPAAVGAGAAASAATVGTVLAVVLGGATPAYAGWSAAPTATSAPSSAAPDCVGALTSAQAGQSGTSSTGTWQTLLTDVRGPFTISLLQNGNSYASCFTSPSFTEVNQITAASGSGGAQSGSLSVRGQSAAGSGSPSQGGVGSQVSLEGTSSGDLSQVLQNHLTTTADGPYTFIDGRVANGVTGVTLVLDDGQDVVATVADGWFVAWWPGSAADAKSAQVTKASGTTSEALVPLSQSGVKFPLGGGSSSGQPGSPPLTQVPGSCTTSTSTTTTTASASGGPSVNCKPSIGTGGGGSPSVNSSGAPGKSASSGNSGTSGNSGDSGNSGGLNTGATGPGPTTKSNP